MNSVAIRLPSVIVPVLSSSSVSTSPAASTARPDIASTLCCTSRSMPAMPIAESNPPIVVGIRHTSSATSTGSESDGAAVQRERIQAHAHQHEDDRQAGQQDAERDFVGRLLALRAFDQRDHAIEEGLARVGRDAHLDPVGDDRGAAGDRAAIAAALANHRRGFAGDRGLVDRGDALDHFAVAGNHFARSHQHDVAAAQRGGRHHALLPSLEQPRLRFGARLAQVVGLRLAASFGHRFGEVREPDREPEPQRDLQFESDQRRVPGEEVADEDDRHRQRGHFDHEHDRIAGLDARVELAHRIDQRAP